MQPKLRAPRTEIQEQTLIKLIPHHPHHDRLYTIKPTGMIMSASYTTVSGYYPPHVSHHSTSRSTSGKRNIPEPAPHSCSQPPQPALLIRVSATTLTTHTPRTSTYTIEIRIRRPPTLLRPAQHLRPVPHQPANENDAPVRANVIVLGVDVGLCLPFVSVNPTTITKKRRTGRAGSRINPRPKHARRLGILEVEPLLEDAAQVAIRLAARLDVAVRPVAHLAGPLRAVEAREEGAAAFGFPVGWCQSGAVVVRGDAQERLGLGSLTGCCGISGREQRTGGRRWRRDRCARLRPSCRGAASCL